MSTVTQLQPRPPEATFAWVQPDDIGDVWDTIRDGLEEVARHGDHWRPEDVYMALRQGQTNLHLARVDGQYAGFVIATPARGYDGPTLHVWAVYAVRGFPRLHAECFAQLRSWAADMKARRITFTSPRKGWERLGKRFGFVPGLTIFECEV
jgi:hypothetical protein